MIGGAVSYVWGSQASLLGRDLGLRRRWGWQASVFGTDFVSLTTLWRAYRRQRYILGVLPTLRVRSVSYASNSWPSADAGHSKRRCWAKFWTAADAENAHSGVGLPACGRLAPLRKVYVVWFRQRTGRLALLRGLYGLFRFWRVGAVRFHSLFQSHTESNRTAPTHQNAKSRFR